MAWIETDRPDRLEHFLAGVGSQARSAGDPSPAAKNPAESVSDQVQLMPRLTEDREGSQEWVAVETIAPDHVAISVNLQDPGVVILADVYYPGWTLSIDGRESEILRVNRMMRGAAVGRGSHRLEYRYSPRSFQFGMMISGSFLFFVLVTWAFLVMTSNWTRTNLTRSRSGAGT
jgi:hypothetical protein